MCVQDESSQRLSDPCFGSSRSLRHVAYSNGSSSISSISSSSGGVTYYNSDCCTPSTVTAASSVDFDFIDSSHLDVTHAMVR